MNNEEQIVWSLIFIGSLIGTSASASRSDIVVDKAKAIADEALSALKLRGIDITAINR